MRGGNPARLAMAPLFAEPPGGWVALADRRIGDEALIAQVGEGQRIASGEAVCRRQRDEARLPSKNLDLELRLARQEPGEGDVNLTAKQIVDSVE